MRWARVHIPRKTSEAVRIWQCKWSHFRNLDVSVMGVVRGWHHLTFAAAVPYVPPALNHCARSETIKTTLRDWRCRPHVTGILRVRQLQSHWLHHDSWKDRIAAVRVDRLSVSGQPWEAFPEGPRPLSDQNRKTCNVTFPEAQLFAYDQTQLPFPLLPAMPLLLFQTGCGLILCKLQMCSNLRPIAVAVPSAWITYARVYLSPSSLSQRKGHLRGPNAFFDQPNESGISPSSTSFCHNTWNVCLFVFMALKSFPLPVFWSVSLTRTYAHLSIPNSWNT